METTERKLSGVMSFCGMLRSNSTSTASIRFTILIELMPISLRRPSTGSVGSGARLVQDLTDEGQQALTHGWA